MKVIEMRILRFGLLIVCMSMATSTTAMAFEVEKPRSVGNWQGNHLYKDESGAFSQCVVSVSYDQGVVLSFALTGDNQWIMGLRASEARLEAGSEVPLTFAVDRQKPIKVQAQATSEEQVFATLNNANSILDLVKRGNRLFVSVQDLRYNFSLRGSSRALTWLLDCVKQYEFEQQPIPKEIQEAIEAAAAPVRSPEEQKADLTVRLAGMLNQAGVAGFGFEVDAGNTDRIAVDWSADGELSGSLSALTKTEADIAKAKSRLVAEVVTTCSGAFSSAQIDEDGPWKLRLKAGCEIDGVPRSLDYTVVKHGIGGLLFKVIGPTLELTSETADKLLDANPD